MSAIETLRDAFREEALALITKDHDAKKVLIAWTLARNPAYVDPGARTATSFSDLIHYVWGQVKNEAVPYEEMSIISSLPRPTVKLKFKQLKLSGLIFPDGSAHPKAMELVVKNTKAHLAGVSSAQRTDR